MYKCKQNLLHSGKVTGPAGELFASTYYTTGVLGQYDGILWGTGSNNYGQLGISTADQTPTSQSNIFQSIFSDVKFADGGYHHTIAVKKDGSVWGAGYNGYGQLGDGTKTNRNKFVKSNIESGAVYVSAAGHSSVVLKDDGSLWAAGHNQFGTLGDGTVTARHTFVKVMDDSVTQVSSGDNSALMLKQDGSVWAAGLNNYGQLGDKTKTDRHTWVKVVEEGVKEVSNGDSHSVFLNDKNELCFTGYNGNGQLGTGDTTQVKGFGLKCYPRPGKP